MDTSETNIKMCEKAEEIQEQYHNFNDDKCFRTNPTAHYPAPGEPHIVWLPRQDQLQEMVGADICFMEIERHFDSITVRGSCQGHNKNSIKVDGFETQEQLWLAFVMKEKYSKVWNGEEWHSAQISMTL